MANLGTVNCPFFKSGELYTINYPGHGGQDIGTYNENRYGEVLAPADGEVTRIFNYPYHITDSTPVGSYTSNETYGIAIRFKLTSGKYKGYYGIFAHLKETYVAKGDTFVKGQVIARQGLTGKTGGPHVHVELCKTDSYSKQSSTADGGTIPPFDFTGVINPPKDSVNYRYMNEYTGKVTESPEAPNVPDKPDVPVKPNEDAASAKKRLAAATAAENAALASLNIAKDNLEIQNARVAQARERLNAASREIDRLIQLAKDENQRILNNIQATFENNKKQITNYATEVFGV